MLSQLSVIESRLLQLIPKGYQNRRTLQEISDLIDLDKRSIQNVISRLVITHYIPICAVRDGGGVFIPISEKERTFGLKSVKNQVIEMSKRIRAVESTDLENWDSQIVLATQVELEV